MIDNDFTIFLDTLVTREKMVNASRRYLGLEYSMRGTFIKEMPDGSVKGKTDCLRLLLLTARDVGFLPPDYDVMVRRPRTQHRKPPSADETMWRMLEANCDSITYEESGPGDIFLIRDSDIDPSLESVHHVAMKTSNDPFPFGTMIHAINRDKNGKGGVEEVRVDALKRNRIEGIYHIRGIIDSL